MEPQRIALVEQCRVAFDFVQQLYNEVGTLIREVEALLAEEEESFKILRPSGYGISTLGSTGIDAQNIVRWLNRRFSVAFVPDGERGTRLSGGQTITELHPELRVLYLRFLLDGYERFSVGGVGLAQPSVLYGVLHGASSPSGRITKFEQMMTDLEYGEKSVFKALPQVDYSGSKSVVRGRLESAALLSLSDAETVAKRLVGPALELYRATGGLGEGAAG